MLVITNVFHVQHHYHCYKSQLLAQQHTTADAVC